MNDKMKVAYLIRELGYSLALIKDRNRGFDFRLRVQALVYIAKKMGIDFSYEFPQYIHCPYSPELANDCYSLTSADLLAVTNDLPFGKTLKIINAKETIWIETAATLIDMKDSNPRETWAVIIRHVAAIKEDTLKDAGKDAAYVTLVKNELMSLLRSKR